MLEITVISLCRAFFFLTRIYSRGAKDRGRTVNLCDYRIRGGGSRHMTGYARPSVHVGSVAERNAAWSLLPGDVSLRPRSAERFRGIV